MAFAITHFLVGASLLLLAAAPLVLRYDLDKAVVMWLIPIGGIWGLLPDLHNVSPVFGAELFAIHNSPWMSLFAFHYLLDTPAVRDRQNVGILLAIVLFLFALSIVSLAYRIRDRQTIARMGLGQLAITGVSGAIAAGFGTIALMAVVSTQWPFDTVARLVGADGVVIGMLVVLVGGLVVGIGYAIGFLLVVPRQYQTTPLFAGTIGAGLGVIAWVGGVVVFVPLWVQWVIESELAIPFVHWASLGGLVLYGLVFGVMYAIVSGAFALGAGDADGAISAV